MKLRFRSTLPMVAGLAILCVAPLPAMCQQAPAPAATKPSQPVKRLPDGHPDLNGFYMNNRGADPSVGEFGSGGSIILKQDGHINIRVGENGAPTAPPADKDSKPVPPRRPPPNIPPYKPELMAKVKDLAKNQTTVDPAFQCKPGGVPRVGPPHAIIQAPGMPIIFLYQVLAGNTYRVIPTDGRAHDPDADPSYYGESIGHWEGDTLVVDTVGFNDDTWLGEPGYFHSTALHVVERISRDGDTLHFQATVEDPNVLTGPWVMNPFESKFTTEHTLENPPCIDSDAGRIKEQKLIDEQKK
jgi:hypothetical protein